MRRNRIQQKQRVRPLNRNDAVATGGVLDLEAFRRVVDAQARMRQKGLSPEEAEMAAFEENAQDAMRVGGT